MEIICLKVGMLATNCYIVYEKKAGECMVIDPGDDTEMILASISENDLKLKYIVLTHGHFDHIGSVVKLKEAAGGKISIHKDDAVYLSNSRLNLSSLAGIHIDSIIPDLLLEDRGNLMIDNIKFEIIHTPGHTRGGICLLAENAIFTGDTLFQLSIGRTDFPAGDLVQLVDSIKTKLYSLDGDYEIYPGHEGKTTLMYEKNNNPYVKL